MDDVLKLEYTVGLDGSWIDETVVTPDYIPVEIINDEVMAMLILNDAYKKGLLQVYLKGEKQNVKI